MRRIPRLAAEKGRAVEMPQNLSALMGSRAGAKSLMRYIIRRCRQGCTDPLDEYGRTTRANLYKCIPELRPQKDRDALTELHVWLERHEATIRKIALEEIGLELKRYEKRLREVARTEIACHIRRRKGVVFLQDPESSALVALRMPVAHGRGRPPTVIDPGKVMRPPDSSPVEKRKRGRPRKYPLPPVVEKRKRGRPRKNPLVPAASSRAQPTESTDAPRAKRGRPKKVRPQPDAG